MGFRKKAGFPVLPLWLGPLLALYSELLPVALSAPDPPPTPPEWVSERLKAPLKTVDGV